MGVGFLFQTFRVDAGTDTCATVHPAANGNPAWICQNQNACGITTPATQCNTADNIVKNSCEKSLCNATGQGADIICCQTKWCAGASLTCSIGQAFLCPNPMYDTEAACNTAVTDAKSKWCLSSDKKTCKQNVLACGTYYDTHDTCIAAVDAAKQASNAGGSSSGSTTTAGTFKEVTDVSLENPIGSSDITQIFGNLIKVALGILGSSALLVFIYGGFMWLVSSGNPERVKKGTSAMVWATIGVVVIFASYAIISLVLQGLGVS